MILDLEPDYLESKASVHSRESSDGSFSDAPPAYEQGMYIPADRKSQLFINKNVAVGG
jgi:hypothetical protein